MSNRIKPRRPWLRIPFRDNVADVAWRAHWAKVRAAERISRLAGLKRQSKGR